MQGGDELENVVFILPIMHEFAWEVYGNIYKTHFSPFLSTMEFHI
jgi:hypothetical protein